MFKLLSKESNIFSIPLYIIVLLLIVVFFNVLDFHYIELFSVLIAFIGVSLGYFVFGQIDLTRGTHLPLFLYTAIVFSLYDGNLDIGLSFSLLINSILLFLLTGTEEKARQKVYTLTGALCMLNLLFLPAMWPMSVFVLLHIFATSQKILLNLFRFFLGVLLTLVGYFSLMFFLGHTHWDPAYFPFTGNELINDFYPVYFLLPLLLLGLYGVLDHFNHYNEIGPTSRFKYTFLLLFALAQLMSIILYMGPFHEFLLILAFPFSLILSRMLLFLPKYSYKEIGLWIILLSLMLYKGGTYFQIF